MSLGSTCKSKGREGIWGSSQQKDRSNYEQIRGLYEWRSCQDVRLRSHLGQSRQTSYCSREDISIDSKGATRGNNQGMRMTIVSDGIGVDVHL